MLITRNKKIVKCMYSGSCPAGYISGVDKTGETAFSLSEYLGRYVVMVFYSGDWSPESQDLLIAFNNQNFGLAGAEVVACSTDTAKAHKCWIKAPR